MSGIVGGRFNSSFPNEMLLDLTGEAATSTWSRQTDDFGLGLAYNSADRHGYATWSDGVRSGVINGALTNLDELDWTVEEVFRKLFRQPIATAAALEGGFSIACQDPDNDRQLVVTDKLGARPMFYTETDPFQYASSVNVLCQRCDEPTLNTQAVSDMLLMGHLWGENTLVEEVLAQRPATVLEVDGGERSVTRYWKPEYTEAAPGKEYVEELTRRYRQAVRRTSTTLPGETGIWLSGGIDSRTTAGALVDHRPEAFETLTAYTYDANPPTNDNPRIARNVAATLNIGYEEVPLTGDTVGENLEAIIEATDGMLTWVYAANLAATYEIESPPPVMMEGMQGALLGDHLYRHHLSGFSSAVGSQLSSEAIARPEQVMDILSESVDPLDTFKDEVERSSESTVREIVLDVHFQNYYTRSFMASNRLMRDRVGTRVPQADGDYLEYCAKLPRSYRKGSLRIRGGPQNGVPFEPTRAKLAVIRRINPALADIIYERSKVKPSWPYQVHVVGFVGNVLYNRLRSKPTYGSSQLPDQWIRDTECPVHEHVSRLVDDACSRDLFDADAVRKVYDDHMNGANNAAMLGQITTLEHWIQTYLD